MTFAPLYWLNFNENFKLAFNQISFLVLLLNETELTEQLVDPRLYFSKSVNLFELQIILYINIHNFDQSCTWKEFTNCGKFVSYFSYFGAKKHVICT